MVKKLKEMNIFWFFLNKKVKIIDGKREMDVKNAMSWSNIVNSFWMSKTLDQTMKMRFKVWKYLKVGGNIEKVENIDREWP